MSLKYATLDDGSLEIEGVGIPFGGPLNGKDLHGQFFSKNTDFHWHLIPDGMRPLLYQHGLDDTLKTAVIGRWAVKRIDEAGVWVRAQLDKRSDYVEEIKQLLDEGALGLSSATMGHLVKVATKSGEILDWPVVELSLTPNPANPDAYVVKADVEAPVEYVAAKLAVLDPEPEPEPVPAAKAEISIELDAETEDEDGPADHAKAGAHVIACLAELIADEATEPEQVSLLLSASRLVNRWLALELGEIASGEEAAEEAESPTPMPIEQPDPVPAASLAVIAGTASEPDPTDDGTIAAFRASIVEAVRASLPRR